MQFLLLSQSGKVTRIDRDQYSAFVDGTTPDYMIRLPDEPTVPHVIDIMPGLGKRANRCRRYVLIKN
jgi:hypothetical protein